MLLEFLLVLEGREDLERLLEIGTLTDRQRAARAGRPARPRGGTPGPNRIQLSLLAYLDQVQMQSMPAVSAATRERNVPCRATLCWESFLTQTSCSVAVARELMQTGCRS